MSFQLEKLKLRVQVEAEDEIVYLATWSTAGQSLALLTLHLLELLDL